MRQPLRPRAVPPATVVGFIQAAYADSGSATTSTQSVTLTAAAAAGSLLVVCGNSDATLTTPSGFTLAASAISSQGGYMWWKIAAGGETTFTTSPSVADTVAMAVVEYGGVVPTSPLDVTVTNTVTSGAPTSGTAGTTPTTAQAAELVVAFVGPHSFNPAAAPTLPSWSNSFTGRAGGATTYATANQNSALFLADFITSSAGTFTSTVTWSNPSADYGAVAAAFKLA